MKGGCPIRWRSVSLTACSALVLAGCGGSATVDGHTDASPRIERDVATRLAAQSDEVARRLTSGDDCGAMAEAGQLRDELTQAINRGVIPEVYLEDLSGAVNAIEMRIPPCKDLDTQLPPPPANEDEDEAKQDENHKDKHKGKGKAKGKKKHDDDERGE